jgi:serine protease Do
MKKFFTALGMIAMLAPLCAPAYGLGRPESFAELAEKVSPAVVNIRIVKTISRGPAGMGAWLPNFEDGEMPDILRRFFGDAPGAPRDFKQRSLGSGVIVERDGYVLTNNHVVANADEIVVIFKGGEELPATIVGRDPKTDLALIKINGQKDLPYLPLGDSDAMRVGDWVMALGNPFGLTSTVTVGIISAKGRNLGAGPYDDFIQTDASINPGNSGGPLVNMDGQVVGINTAIVAQGQGIGFAIPSSLVKDILKQLRDKGRVTRGWLGIYFQPVNKELAQQFSLPENQGVLVADVVADGPASKAGLLRGDVILKFDGKEISDSHTLPRMVAETPVGEKVKLVILRNHEEKVLTIVIGEMPDSDDPEESSAEPKPDRNLGMQLENITPDLARQLKLDRAGGVVVRRIERGSPADEAGIRQGDIIVEVARKAVNNIRDFNRIIDELDKSQGVLLLVRRQGVTHYVVVKTVKAP